MTFNITGFLISAVWIFSGFWSLEKLSGSAGGKGGAGERLLPWLNLLALVTGPVIPLLLYGKPLFAVLKERIRDFVEKDRSGLEIIRSSSGDTFDRILLAGENNEAAGSAEVPLKRLLAAFLSSGAVDMAIDCSGGESAAVSYRKDNKWLAPKPLSGTGEVISLLKGAAGISGVVSGRPQSGVFQLKSGKRIYDVAVSVLPVVAGERISLALTEAIREPENAAELGIGSGDLKDIAAMLASGGAPLIIIGGAAQSGRSKTLHAILKEAVPAGRTVSLLESRRGGDAVAGVIQMQADAAAGVSLASLLEAVVDQRSDIIAVDELSGKEVMAGVLKAVKSGIPVIAVVEADDLPGVMNRLFALGAAPAELDRYLSLIIHQQLTGRLCRHCAAADQLPEYLQMFFADSGLAAGGIRKAVGCRDCQGSGYRGVCGVFDFYTPGCYLKDALNAVPVQQTAVRHAIEKEHKGVLFGAALSLAAAGVISVADAERLGQSGEEDVI